MKPDIEAELERAAEYAAAVPANTRRAYAGDWKRWCAWAAERQLARLPAKPEHVGAYLVWLADAGKRTSTIERALSSIAAQHRKAGQPNPRDAEVVQRTFYGIQQKHGSIAQQKAAISPKELEAMVATLPKSIMGLRDHALLALGYAGAFRRADLAALAVSDLRFVQKGLTVLLRRSKADQKGEGRLIGIPHGAPCNPVRAVQLWLDQAGIKQGPVFRAIDRFGHIANRQITDRVVALVIKRAGLKAGLDPDQLGGHSLRSGLVTAAAKANKRRDRIRQQTGHKSDKMLDKYIREANLFEDNAADGLE